MIASPCRKAHTATGGNLADGCARPTSRSALGQLLCRLCRTSSPPTETPWRAGCQLKTSATGPGSEVLEWLPSAFEAGVSNPFANGMTCRCASIPFRSNPR
jgi:hypothetical protein